MGLTDIITGVYSAVKGEREDILMEYPKAPVRDQPDIFAVMGVKYIKLSEPFCYEGGEDYPAEISLNIRVLGREGCDPVELYGFFDECILDPLAQEGYSIRVVTVSGPDRDNAIKRLVVGAAVTIYAESARKENDNGA